jgi:hypothetical protein
VNGWRESLGDRADGIRCGGHLPLAMVALRKMFLEKVVVGGGETAS